MTEEDSLTKLNKWFDDEERYSDTSRVDGVYSVSSLDLEDNNKISKSSHLLSQLLFQSGCTVQNHNSTDEHNSQGEGRPFHWLPKPAKLSEHTSFFKHRPHGHLLQDAGKLRRGQRGLTPLILQLSGFHNGSPLTQGSSLRLG